VSTPEDQIPEHVNESAPLDYWADLPEANVEELPAGTRLLVQVNSANGLAADVARLEKELAEKQEELSKVKRELIPEIMKELGLEETTLTDGRKVVVKKKAKYSVPEEKAKAFYKWLEETENDGIVKTNVACEFGRGEMEQAKKAREILEQADFFPSLNQSVHYQTLQSFCKEQQEKGTQLPEQVNVFEFTEAEIKTPKAKKK
jgi:hypothetical protein